MARSTEEVYACTICKKTRTGRFTRPQSGASGSWVKGRSQGLHLPCWYCWECLPAGQGRDEGDETVAQKAKATAAKAETLVPAGKAKSEAITESSKLTGKYASVKAEVESLTVTDAETYLMADTMLGQIRQVRKGWLSIWERIQERTIKPIRDGLEELYSLNRDTDRPWETLETALKGKMGDYKRLEAQKLLQAQQAKDREEQRLRDEARAKEEAAAKAATPQMAGRLAAQAQRLTQAAVEVQQEEAPAPVQGGFAGTRSKETWEVKDLIAFHKGIADGLIPVECGAVNKKEMDALWKDSPEDVLSFPGVSKTLDITIVSR